MAASGVRRTWHTITWTRSSPLTPSASIRRATRSTPASTARAHLRLVRPGRQCEPGRRATRKSRDGQRGIISCFAFAPDRSGLRRRPFSGTTGLYVENQPGLIQELGAHGGGVTQLAFSSTASRTGGAARRRDPLLGRANERARPLRLHPPVPDQPKDRVCRRRRARGRRRLGELLVTASQDGRVLAYQTCAPDAPPTALHVCGRHQRRGDASHAAAARCRRR